MLSDIDAEGNWENFNWLTFETKLNFNVRETRDFDRFYCRLSPEWEVKLRENWFSKIHFNNAASAGREKRARNVNLLKISNWRCCGNFYFWRYAIRFALCTPIHQIRVVIVTLRFSSFSCVGKLWSLQRCFSCDLWELSEVCCNSMHFCDGYFMNFVDVFLLMKFLKFWFYYYRI